MSISNFMMTIVFLQQLIYMIFKQVYNFVWTA